MLLNKKNAGRGKLNPIGYPILILSLVTIIASYQSSAAGDLKQKTFQSPDEAVKALIESVRSKEKGALLAIFGPSGKEIISSGDEVVDSEMGERFLKAYDEGNKIVSKSPTKMVLHVGKDDSPFPIPIVKKGEVWLFDTRAGKEEILNRRIGRNELSTIQVCLAYVDAQREYARISQAAGLMEYAQRFASSSGKKDGLYWNTKEGEPPSPLGPLVAKAVKEGYQKKESGKQAKGQTLTPYHGYYYKILKAQGKNASGGEYDYMIKGKMIAGFALVAYPAQYGLSGVMTFIVNHDGVVYEKDLRKATEKLASAMKKYDPDKTWKRAE